MTACQRLAVLSFPGAVSKAAALAAIGRLERSHSLVVLDAVLVERAEDGTPHVAGLYEGAGEECDAAAFVSIKEAIQHRIAIPRARLYSTDIAGLAGTREVRLQDPLKVLKSVLSLFDKQHAALRKTCRKRFTVKCGVGRWSAQT